MTTIRKDSYEPICQYVGDTNARVDQHSDASPELKSAMKEFREKAHDLHKNYDTADIENNVIEIEQAADSALKVARASKAPETLTSQIENAHDQVRDFKQQVQS